MRNVPYHRPSDLHIPYTLSIRQCLGLKEAHQNWKVQGKSRRTMLKKFHNVQFPPLLDEKDENVKVLSLIPPPPLHLLRLGPVNKIMDSLTILAPEETKMIEKTLHVVRENYFSGNFEGKLFKRMSFLHKSKARSHSVLRIKGETKKNKCLKFCMLHHVKLRYQK